MAKDAPLFTDEQIVNGLLTMDPEITSYLDHVVDETDNLLIICLTGHTNG